MFLTIIDPRGRFTSFDLANLQVWALALEAIVWPPVPATPEGGVPPKNALGLGIKYVVAGVATFQTIAAIDLKASGEAEKVAEVGLPKRTVEENHERLRESLKVIINSPSHTASEANDIIARAAGLAKVYHELLRALFGNVNALQNTDSLYVSEFEGWRYSVTQTRFTLPPSMQGSGTAMSNAGGLGAPPGGGQTLGGGSLLPPPTERKASRPSHRKPPSEAPAAAPEQPASPPTAGNVPAPMDDPGDGAPPES